KATAQDTSLVRRSEWPQDVHSNRVNLAAELPACRTPKHGFNTTQGDFSDAPQLCPRCPVGGLNAKACHDRRQVTGKVCRLDFLREFAFRLRLLQTLLQSRFAAFSPVDIESFTCSASVPHASAPWIERQP